MSRPTSVQLSAEARARAAALAREIALGLQQGRSAQWIEEVIGSALVEFARLERERCASVAHQRVQMWESSLKRYDSGEWPREATSEARQRHNEAVVIADAIQAQDSIGNR